MRDADESKKERQQEGLKVLHVGKVKSGQATAPLWSPAGGEREDHEAADTRFCSFR